MKAVLPAALALLPIVALADPPQVHDAIAARELVCEFREGWRHGVLAGVDATPGPVTFMRFFETITAERAEVLSTRTPGRRSVSVHATAQAVHFIERVGPSVRATTLTGCERSKMRQGIETCVRFRAQHAWHFDDQAARDPDGSFARQPSGAAIGACEPWRVDPAG